MELSLDKFRTAQIVYPDTYEMQMSRNMIYYNELEKKQKERKLTVDDTYERLRERTSEVYFTDIHTAQAQPIDYADKVFPAYKFLIPEILIDDWLSLIDPHREERRDHSLHQPLTAYIISQLLGNGDIGKGLKINNQSLLSICAENLLDKPKMEYLRQYLSDLDSTALPSKTDIGRVLWASEVFYEATFVAALFHDIGYPWQYVNQVGSGIGIVDHGMRYEMEMTAKNIYGMIANRLLIYPFHGYSPSAVHSPMTTWKSDVMNEIHSAFVNTHGFPGALAFQYLNDKMRTANDASDCMVRFIQDWAAVGIMMHDMLREFLGKKSGTPYPNFRLSMDTDPLSCLVAMADVLEEFERPKATFKGYTNDARVTYESSCNITEIDIVGDVLKVTYKFANKPSTKDIEGRNEEIDAYFNNADKFIDLSSIGINKVECISI